MKKTLALFGFPAWLLAFWLSFFGAFRLWFVLWFPEKLGSQTWAACWRGLPLDLSTAGYLMALPMLIFWGSWRAGEARRKTLERLASALNTLFISLLVLIFTANIFLYEEWQTLLNRRALAYLSTPAALLDSMSASFQIAAALLLVGLSWASARALKWCLGGNFFSQKQPHLFVALLLCALQMAALGLLIRGGAGVMPINESAVYYSPNLFDNHAATNPAWHLLHSLVEARNERNPFIFKEKEAAEAEISRLLAAGKQAARASVLDTNTLRPKPNLVCIVMESMTAQVVAELGGMPGVCPNLGRLAREGVLFERVFSSGYRTDQGLVSVLSGYPAQPDQSVVLLEDKAAKLPSLPRILRENGYSTAYFYGGELTFANIGVYLRQQGFEQIFSEKDFDSAEKTQRWGVDDGRLLQRAVAEIGQLPEPFFATCMTLSLHPPYDAPYSSQWLGNQSDRAKFLNSAAFADHAIGQFFERARQEKWYANTLFVLVADHGSSQPQGLSMDVSASRHLPLVLFGAPLAADWRGQRVAAMGNHHDFPATILPVLGLKSAAFRWSRDLLAQDPAGGFAYFTNENGLGWATPAGEGYYNFESKKWNGSLDSAAQAQAKAFLQALYDDFLGL